MTKRKSVLFIDFQQLICGKRYNFPTMYPSDVDGFLVETIRKTLERKDVCEIALLSGDTGYYEVLKTAKRAGVKIKVIIPPESNSHLLRSVADEVKNIGEYAEEYVPETLGIERAHAQAVAMEDKGEVAMAMVTGGR